LEDARVTAYKIISAVLREESFYNLALKKHLNPRMSTEDRRFAASLSALTLEHAVTIDYYLKHFIQAKRLQPAIQDILRLGACQILHMNVPASAAVNESVKLAKKTGKGALSGFVNAVLRNFAKGYGAVNLPDESEDPPAYLSIKHGFPLWIVKRLAADYGTEEAQAFLSFPADTKDTTVRMNTLKTDADAFEKALRAAGYEYRKSALVPGCYHIQNISDIENTDIYRRGEATAMGEASMTAVRAVSPLLAGGVSLLDACAAPGGKSAYAAALLKNGGSITAWDIHPHRTELIQKNFERLGVGNYEIAVKDASVRDPACDGRFDLVIVDAPCSALGLVHKKPDIRLHRKEADIPALAALQQEILGTCANYVKRGGHLAYFTCTVLKEENEDTVRAFLKADGRFRPSEKLFLPEPLQSRAKDGCVTLLPQADGTDGFFISLMERCT
jgi:16S rRNA (cytosine967-C5)-methyltransferase